MNSTNYIVVLDHYSGRILEIRLTDCEKKKLEQYQDFEDFIQWELCPAYGFRIEDCSWMSCSELDECRYNF